MYYNFIGDVVISKHNTIYNNANTNVTNINKLVNSNGRCYFAKKIEHTNFITNSITRHNLNNYEHNAVKQIHKHITHNNYYGTGINYYNKKSLNTNNCYNLYHDTCNFRNNKIISSSQQPDITGLDAVIT